MSFADTEGSIGELFLFYVFAFLFFWIPHQGRNDKGEKFIRSGVRFVGFVLTGILS